MLRKLLFIFAVGCALSFAQEIEGNVTAPLHQSNESTTVKPPNVSTSTANPAKSTSSSPDTNTTIPTSSSTTTPHTSTTTPQTNTTVAPTTTTPRTNTTTTSPSTPVPSTEPPTPTTALPPPSKGHYYVKDGNDTCIIADMAVQVKLVVKNESREFDVPANITSEGFCTNVTDILHLSWEEVDEKFGLIFQFSKNQSTNKFMVSSLNFTVSQQNVTLNLTNNKPLFTASVSKSYRCEKEQEIKLQENETNDTYAILKLSHLQLEAFNTKGSDDKFSAAEDCAGPYSPDIVPIAVGCALVGLIAIVLIAYLVGRRRSQSRGYLSM